MGQLIVFNHISLNGYFVGENGDLSWAYQNSNDAEWNSYVRENARGDGILLFGRITYQMMASYWPTPQAKQFDPVIADRMNMARKVVFSRTLDSATWAGTALVKGNLPGEVRTLKKENDVVILGSGSIVTQVAQEGLVDEYQLVVNPVAIGTGRTLFEGATARLPMKLAKTRTFGNGNVLLCYAPKGRAAE